MHNVLDTGHGTLTERRWFDTAQFAVTLDDMLQFSAVFDVAHTCRHILVCKMRCQEVND